jgi:hypothetical protein
VYFISDPRADGQIGCNVAIPSERWHGSASLGASVYSNYFLRSVS